MDDEKKLNLTEDRYALVEELLKDIKVAVPTAVLIMKNITGITEALAEGTSSKEIVRMFELGIKHVSFAGIYKRTTGTSVTDIAKKTARDKAHDKLFLNGYVESEIEKILDLVEV